MVGNRAQVPLLDRVFPFLPVFRDYSAEKARRDFVAGLTVALFTIPQAMAYALIAGFPPAAGIFTAVVASILGAAFGSSEFLINGPTNAIAAMIASNIALLASQGDPHKLVVLLTLMIGVSQCIVSLFKAGNLTRFVSEPVLTGFTAGAGVYIAINQLPSALGIEKKALVTTLGGWTPPSVPIADLARTLASLAQTNKVALGVALATILLVRALQWLEPRFKRRIPAPFFTVVAVSFAAFLLALGEAGPEKIKLVRDIEPVSRILPKLVWPEATIDQILAMLGPTFAIAMLGAVEAIAIGKSLASRVGHRFDANRQLVGEGACNIGAALVGGFAASGSFSRTAVNFEAGALTRVSCFFSGALILALVWMFAPAANYIPIAVLAGMLIHIGFKLVNVAKMRLIMEATRSDKWVLAATFVGVLIFPHLEHALFLGVFLSIGAALKKAEGFKLKRLVEDDSGNLIEEDLDLDKCGEVATLDLQGEMFFAAAEDLEHKLKAVLACGTKFLVLRLQQAYNMDMTCADAIGMVAAQAQKEGGRLILCGVRPGVHNVLQRARIVDKVGAENIFLAEPTKLGSTHKAIEFANSLNSPRSA
ncbi:MAG: SulP family inorganic anion transporter [Fimbriimonas sp.]